eukprot:TRINITY_DN10010_c0_g1_i1.p1 TRINITY_DN10010_c0_g1~~TRINITY_DN10010_c0_g1_i1.p1  ORF type:complete len:339 (+),score=64.58 TRINITY_DN10010_c0_g1_i1:204-1220(+)
MGVAAGHHLAGSVVVITGGDTGIGLATATALATGNATIILAVHNITHGAEVAWNLTIATGNPHIEAVGIDLASRASVRACAAWVAGRYPVVDVLVNNAGIGWPVHGLPIVTEDGFERIFQTNYLGHFELTQLLLPSLRRSQGARVINVASSASYQACPWGNRDVDCLASQGSWEVDMRTSNGTTCVLPARNCTNCCVVHDGNMTNTDGITASNYGITKLMLVAHTRELAAREQAAGSGLMAFSLHPGFVETPLTSHLSPSVVRAWCAPQPVKPGVCPLTPDAGAATGAFLALAPASDLVSGFYGVCQPSALPNSTGWNWLPGGSTAQLFDATLSWLGY